MIDRHREIRGARPGKWLAWLLLAGHMVGAQADNVYECIGAAGQVAFQDRPCAASANQTEIAPPPAPVASPPPEHAAGQKANAGRAKHTPRNTGSRRAESGATSYECRAADGQVFYRHHACPKSVPALDPGAGKHAGRGAAAKNPAKTVTVVSTRIPREEACYELRRGGATGRVGHKYDQDASTYAKDLGHDPCR